MIYIYITQNEETVQAPKRNRSHYKSKTILSLHANSTQQGVVAKVLGVRSHLKEPTSLKCQGPQASAPRP